MSLRTLTTTKFVRAAILGAILCLLDGYAQGQVPQLISYQGRVIVGTTNFNGTGSFKFALVNNGNGETLWSNDGTSVNGSEPTNPVSLDVSNGLYSVLLGDNTVANMTPIPNSVFGNSDVRLRVWFDDGSHGSQQLSPDQRIAAVGYAMMAENVADGSISSEKLAPGAVGSSQLADGAVSSQKIDTATVQQRITGSAPAGTFIQSVNADGTVVAAPISTGSGLINFGGTISLDSTIPRLNSANAFSEASSFPAVGIGTTIPTWPLEVVGSAEQSALFSSTTIPNNIFIRGSTGTTGGIGIQTNTSDPVHTAIALLSNSRAVNDGFNLYDPSITGSELVMESNYDVGGGVRQNEFYWQNEGGYRPLQSSWRPVAGTAQTGVYGSFAVNGDDPRLINPNYMLADFREANPGNYTGLAVFNSDSLSKGAIVVIGGNANSFEERGWNLGNDVFADGGQNFFITNRLSHTFPFFIDASDHIGIGTMLPFAKLAIAGSGTDDIFAINSSAGQRVFTVTSGGKLGIGTTSPNETLEIAPGETTLADTWQVRSSQRWKTNIQTIANALEEVRKLRGVTYDWRDGRGRDIGLIAEEVGRVLPEIVTYEPNGIDARSVDYQRLVALLIEAVKEQDQEISRLRETIESSGPARGQQDKSVDQ